MGTKKDPKQTVMKGSVFASLLEEMHSAAEEIAARRKWGEQVSEYLKSKSLIEDFEAWRKAKDDVACKPSSGRA